MTFSNAAYHCRAAADRLSERGDSQDALCQNLYDIAEALQGISYPRPVDDIIERFPARMRELLGWLSGDIPELHAVEVPRLAASLDRFLRAKRKTVTCHKCGEPMTWTATAPIRPAPMEWRCFTCPVDLGSVATNSTNGEHVIEVNEAGQVSETVKGPIRDGR